MTKTLSILTILTLLTAYAPITVLIEQQKTLERINSERELKEWDFGTASFYIDICNSHHLNHKSICKAANQALRDYQTNKYPVKRMDFY